MVPVIVTLTTIPARLPHLWPVLDSLLHNQTLPPAMVVVNVPQNYAAGLGSVDAIPDTWKSSGSVRLVVNRECRDLGPATKVVGAAAIVERHPKALVLYLDDDHIPNRFLVQAHALVQHRSVRPAVWCGRGEIVRQTPFSRKIIDQSCPSCRVHIPSGVGSVSVPAVHLRIAALLKRVEQLSPLARMADDMVFADWFARHGLPVQTIGQNFLLKVRPQATDEWALHLCHRSDCTTLPDERYRKVAAELNASFPPLVDSPATRRARGRVKIWNS